MDSKQSVTGYLTFTLHAHLPYVVNHGTWPHGLEWLLEAAAETYLPLLRVLRNLKADGIALHCNLNLTPVLLEQLAHPVFREEFPRYLGRKITAAREDEAFFRSTGEAHFAETARFWQSFFTLALDDFNAIDGNIVRAFREAMEAGALDILTCAATHGYLPLLGTDESVRAQVRTGVATHERHLGRKPRGMWVPECGYRPAGLWSYPTTDEHGLAFAGAPSPRIGVEQALSESGIEFFFADTHMVEASAAVQSPYAPFRRAATALAEERAHTIYQPHVVDGPYIHGTGKRSAATVVFPRDPRTGLQVWSGDTGYPGDAEYLDFHKKRWPGGHRYWRVTGGDVDMGDKAPYTPAHAAARVQAHAEHFVQLVHDALAPQRSHANPPILCSPFDAELFGHWWFEGPQWLEAVARLLHASPDGVQLTTCADYLDRFPPLDLLRLPEGSWGAGGGNAVWLNDDTRWTYARLYAAEIFCRDICTATDWQQTPLRTRVAQQLCRELLLLESSDWQFLITTGAARDYAELRFHTHHDQFNELRAMYTTLLTANTLGHPLDDPLDATQRDRLTAIEARDNIFPDIDPADWRSGSRAATPADPLSQASAA